MAFPPTGLFTGTKECLFHCLAHLGVIIPTCSLLKVNPLQWHWCFPPDPLQGSGICCLWLKMGDVDKPLLPKGWVLDMWFFSSSSAFWLFTDASRCCSPFISAVWWPLEKRVVTPKAVGHKLYVYNVSSRSSIPVTPFPGSNFIVNIPGFHSTQLLFTVLWFKTEWFRAYSVTP